MQVGRDAPPTVMRDTHPPHNFLSLADNREVSPAPVTNFSARSLSNKIGHNRVTVPFSRAQSFKGTSFSGLQLKRLSNDSKQPFDRPLTSLFDNRKQTSSGCELLALTRVQSHGNQRTPRESLDIQESLACVLDSCTSGNKQVQGAVENAEVPQRSVSQHFSSGGRHPHRNLLRQFSNISSLHLTTGQNKSEETLISIIASQSNADLARKLPLEQCKSQFETNNASHEEAKKKKLHFADVFKAVEITSSLHQANK